MKPPSLTLLFCFACFFGANIHAQRLVSGDGLIIFTARAPLDTIQGRQDSTRCEFDVESGRLRFVVPVANFQFRHPQTRLHFNLNFLETQKHPLAEFEGQILEYNRPALESKKEYPIKVRGRMTLHGITKEIQVDGRLKWENKSLAATSIFALNVSEYGISIPSLLRDNIAEVVEISVNILWKK